ncbi:MAG: hypothetical protein JRG73_06825 [Deltaproteobacteria bacterium]|nr:hypothetical protein [Deltaproteobacteria bacterium]MBW2306637.1 hypothetical protein [Deltaproteobacteria bacterium]
MQVPFEHKIALVDLAHGEKIIKCGRPIGVAVRDISVGDHVHVHNVGGLRAMADTSERGEDQPCGSSAI